MSLSQEELIDYLVDEHDVDPDDLEPQTPLFTSGLLDSYIVLEVIMFVEKHIGQRINAADFTIDHFDSVAKIVAFAAERSG